MSGARHGCNKGGGGRGAAYRGHGQSGRETGCGYVCARDWARVRNGDVLYIGIYFPPERVRWGRKMATAP